MIDYCLVKASLSSAQTDFESLAALDTEIKSFKVGPNPYTWFTMEALEDTWRNLQKIISERDSELLKEAQRQEDNDRLRKEFARHANAFHQWLTETRYILNNIFLFFNNGYLDFMFDILFSTLHYSMTFD